MMNLGYTFFEISLTFFASDLELPGKNRWLGCWGLPRGRASQDQARHRGRRGIYMETEDAVANGVVGHGEAFNLALAGEP